MEKKVIVRKKGADPPKEVSLAPKYLINQADRVSIGFGQKIQIVQFEPVDINVFYSSDVREGETVEQAFARVTNVVSKKAKEEISKIVAVKNKNKK